MVLNVHITPDRVIGQRSPMLYGGFLARGGPLATSAWMSCETLLEDGASLTSASALAQVY